MPTSIAAAHTIRIHLRRSSRKKAAANSTVKKPAPAAPRFPRRDGAGHLSPKYAADLRRRAKGEAATRNQNEDAFVHGTHVRDDLAEQLAEEMVGAATSGEDAGEDLANQDVPEERGGPFVVTSAGTEFAEGTDESNPKGSKREPFPRT